jgi:hypothetical protein
MGCYLQITELPPFPNNQNGSTQPRIGQVLFSEGGNLMKMPTLWGILSAEDVRENVAIPTQILPGKMRSAFPLNRCYPSRRFNIRYPKHPVAINQTDIHGMQKICAKV